MHTPQKLSLPVAVLSVVFLSSCAQYTAEEMPQKPYIPQTPLAQKSLALLEASFEATRHPDTCKENLNDYLADSFALTLLKGSSTYIYPKEDFIKGACSQKDDGKKTTYSIESVKPSPSGEAHTIRYHSYGDYQYDCNAHIERNDYGTMYIKDISCDVYQIKIV